MKSVYIATCDCKSKEFKQTEVVYNEEAQADVCKFCEHFPVYKRPLLVNIAPQAGWREEFATELRELVAHWQSDDQSFEESFVRRVGGSRE